MPQFQHIIENAQFRRTQSTIAAGAAFRENSLTDPFLGGYVNVAFKNLAVERIAGLATHKSSIRNNQVEMVI
jgi:hypothetical protein